MMPQRQQRPLVVVVLQQQMLLLVVMVVVVVIAIAVTQQQQQQQPSQQRQQVRQLGVTTAFSSSSSSSSITTRFASSSSLTSTTITTMTPKTTTTQLFATTTSSSVPSSNTDTTKNTGTAVVVRPAGAAAILHPPISMEELLLHSTTATTTATTDTTSPTRVQELYNAVVQTTYGRYPLTIARGDGCRLMTTDGNEYLDCVAGIATCALGHANPYLNMAIQQQMSMVHHVSNLYYIPTQAALALWLTQNSVADKVFFCNSGAEANEAAIKCARRHASNRNITQPIIITAEQSFHGRTLGALSATGQAKYHKGFTYDGQMMPGFVFIPYNDIDALRNAVQQIQQDPHQGLAGIMMEALQGEGGIIPGHADFFQTIREICTEEDAFMICDEVQIGMGRSGKLWGYENLQVEPDIFTSAKALGGGVPIGAMMARGKAATTFGPGDHASTYGGNPLACAAGLAVAQYLSDHNILQNVNERHVQLQSGLEQLVTTKYSNVLGEVRGWGLLMGIEVLPSPKNDDGTATITPGSIVQEAMNCGLLLVGAGTNMIRFVPPLIITKEEIDELVTKFDLAVANVVAKTTKVVITN